MASALSSKQKDALLTVLKARFEKHMHRHEKISWVKVEEKVRGDERALHALLMMEETGGEPDVVGLDAETSEIIFFDCSEESPKGRRSVCYDRLALEARKEHKPKDSALGMASDMGVELLTEEEYRQLQECGEFDRKTSSWVQTPSEIRKRGGAIFCDRRYDTVFTYHNGAESYYAARGFRGSLRV